MKSRREYFESRRLLMIVSRICYALTIFLIVIFGFVKSGFATIAVTMFLFLMVGITCSLYAHRNKEYLFCPKCGSKNIVKTGFLGVPVSITDECLDCKQKINIDKSIYKD